MPFHSRLVVAAAAALAPSATAHADGATQVKIDGIGAAACSQVMARFDGGGGPLVGEAILQWTYGYLSRRNVERGLASQATVDLALAVNEDKLLNVILKTCRGKPDLHVFQVVDAVYEVLLEKGTLTS